MNPSREPIAPSAQARFELDTYGYTVLERVIDEDAAAALAGSLSAADAAIGTEYVHQEAYARHVMSLLSWLSRRSGQH